MSYYVELRDKQLAALTSELKGSILDSVSSTKIEGGRSALLFSFRDGTKLRVVPATGVWQRVDVLSPERWVEKAKT